MANSAILYSGGLDSTVLLYQLIRELRPTDQVFAIMIHYGAVHNEREILSARDIIYNLRRTEAPVTPVEIRIPGVVDVSKAFFPSASFEDLEKEGLGNPVIFPGRNLLLVAIANAFAVGVDAKELWMAVGGHDVGFPDCTFEFVMRLGQAMHHGYKTVLQYPYVDKNRTWIVQKGATLNVPFADTYSCYRGGPIQCGVCPTCQERKLSFISAGIEDTTQYVE